MSDSVRGYPLRAFVICLIAYTTAQMDLALFSYAVTVFRAEAGKRRVLPGPDHLRVVFVMKGRGKCGRKDYKRHSALEFAAGETAAVTPEMATELLVMTLPSVAALGLKAA